MHAYSKFDLLIVICHGGANQELLVVQKKELAYLIYGLMFSSTRTIDNILFTFSVSALSRNVFFFVAAWELKRERNVEVYSSAKDNQITTESL